MLLTLAFLAPYRSEKTLSTFALGTATGDLIAEVLGLGDLATGPIVAALIAVMAIGWRSGLNPVLAFWFIYVLTRQGPSRPLHRV